jgi:HEAT repeat protein
MLTAQEMPDRLHAATALAELGPVAARALPMLCQALEDENRRVRYTAAKALGAIGPAALDAIPALEQARDGDPDNTVRHYAKQAILRIRGAEE